jgi:HAD superfamily hydrolase (TIGR01548 family)
MSKEYLEMEVNGEKAYLRKDVLGALKQANAVVFDCDGVLIDVRNSYNQAIYETVTYFLKALTGLKPPENGVSEKLIHLFRKTGGFNNDWNITYAILLFILSQMPKKFREDFEKYVGLNLREANMMKRFLSVKDGVRKEYAPIDLDRQMADLEAPLKQFALSFDSLGIASLGEKLKCTPEFYSATKNWLAYPGEVGKSILTTVFEEIFCGSQLFREAYGQEPQFYNGQGLIEKERVIIRPETFDQLTRIFGGANFGIASGRPTKLADFTLKGLLKRFDSKTKVFLEDIEEAERITFSNQGVMVNLKKPNPFSLFRSLEGLKHVVSALYVGDSMADMVTVKTANTLDSRFLFAGVYCHSELKDDVVCGFLEDEAELVLPSVNELPVVLNAVKGGETL